MAIAACSATDKPTDVVATRTRTSLGRRGPGRGCSGPERAQPGADIDGGTGRRVCGVVRCGTAVAHAGEARQDGIGDEPRARRIDVRVAVASLLPDEEAKRVDDVELVAGA